MADFDPYALEDVLSLLSNGERVLIGGQAINIWSIHYGRKSLPPWRDLQPFTSKDVDIFAGGKEVKEFSNELLQRGYHVEVILPKEKSEYRVNTALLSIEKDGRKIEINCLRAGLDLSAQEVLESSVLIETPIPCRVLHPLLCVTSKFHNLVFLDQSNRQDEKHLKLAIGNLREFLIAVDQPEMTGQVIDRLGECACNDNGASIFMDLGINLFDSLPESQWENRAEWVEIKNKASGVKAQFEAIISDVLEVNQWLDSLQNSDR